MEKTTKFGKELVLEFETLMGSWQMRPNTREEFVSQLKRFEKLSSHYKLKHLDKVVQSFMKNSLEVDIDCLDSDPILEAFEIAIIHDLSTLQIKR